MPGNRLRSSLYTRKTFTPKDNLSALFKARQKILICKSDKKKLFTVGSMPISIHGNCQYNIRGIYPESSFNDYKRIHIVVFGISQLKVVFESKPKSKMKLVS